MGSEAQKRVGPVMKSDMTLEIIQDNGEGPISIRIENVVDFNEAMPPVVQFLLGEGELEGCEFGQTKPVNAIGEFWWRKYLRDAWRKRCQNQ